MAVRDVPLLFETGGEKRCDATVVVSAPAHIQAARVLARPGMTMERLEQIRSKQMPDAQKRRRADYVVPTGLGKRVIAIEWQQFPTGAQNPDFVDELRAHGVREDQPVYFLCRSGARSRFAAVSATAAGFEHAYNVADGFEGPPNTDGQRGRVAGWKAADLPWRQT